ncbi:MAG TPA: dihydroorotase [Thermoleophilia bacterium]|nr:dihydroorotase [Thermoleophilia bacterium]
MKRTWCKHLPAAELLIKGGRVVDPESGVDAVQDVLVKKGKVAEVGKSLKAGKNTRVVDAAGMLVLPGFVDLHAHFRTPGREDEEDIATASAAAAAGGYVAAFGMANTDPVVDTATILTGLSQRASVDALVPVGFFAAVTKGLAGEELTEMGELGAAGAVGFSDDGQSLKTAAITRRALQYVKVSGRFVAIHAQDDSLFKGGQMHEGPASARLGLTGIPSLCESLDVSRALDIAAYEDADLHVCHVSSAASLEAIARAKEAGVRVTAEVTPHHLVMNDEVVATLDPNVKMNPPLRSEGDRRALVEALRSGLVDCVATDHAPHVSEEKDVPYEEAPFGVVGLETAFSVLHAGLVEPGELDLATLVTRLSAAPARIAGLEAPAIAVGAPADLCVIDPAAVWTVAPHTLQSRSWNSPWLGNELTGKVRLTVAAGRVAWDDRA